jgi:hypothetical protein
MAKMFFKLIPLALLLALLSMPSGAQQESEKKQLRSQGTRPEENLHDGVLLLR